MPYSVRSLNTSDLESFRDLLKVFAGAFEDLPTYIQSQPDDHYLQAFLAKSHVFVVIAENEKKQVIAGLVAYALDKFEQARSEIYIYDLAVDINYRRQGIATALIQCLQQQAAAYGAYVIFVQADYGDDPAIALYEKLGIREQVLHFDISVPTR